MALGLTMVGDSVTILIIDRIITDLITMGGAIILEDPIIPILITRILDHPTIIAIEFLGIVDTEAKTVPEEPQVKVPVHLLQEVREAQPIVMRDIDVQRVLRPPHVEV